MVRGNRKTIKDLNYSTDNVNWAPNVAKAKCILILNLGI